MSGEKMAKTKLNNLGNRGTVLEELLETIFDADSNACMLRQANRIVLLRNGTAFPQKGAPIDFVGVIKGIPVAVECKETKINRLPLNKSRFPQKEIDALQRFYEAGGNSFVVAAYWKHDCLAVFSYKTFEKLLKTQKSASHKDADAVFPVGKVKKITEVLCMYQ